MQNLSGKTPMYLKRERQILERSEYAEAAEKNTQQVRKHPSIYSAQQQIIEHVFGTIKRQWGYDHILLKGLRKNEGSPSHEASAINKSSD